MFVDVALKHSSVVFVELTSRPYVPILLIIILFCFGLDDLI